MSYVSPRDLFIQECIANGCSKSDTLFLADMEFDANGDVIPGSIYDCYRPKQ